MYVSIGIKPESVCEIQDAVGVKSGIIISIHLVKTFVEGGDKSNIEDEDGVLHRTKILLNIVSILDFRDRVVCDDSYFSSVAASQALKYIGLSFVGIVKYDTKQSTENYF